jgi:hypothetical protein
MRFEELVAIPVNQSNGIKIILFGTGFCGGSKKFYDFSAVYPIDIFGGSFLVYR